MNLKIYFSILALFISSLSIGQEYIWGINFGGNGEDVVRAMAVDDDGNVFTTGYYTDTSDFDPSENTAEFVAEGFFDIYIHKVNSDGDLEWARSIGGSFFEYGTGIEIDPDGAVLVTGVFTETVDFDPGEGEALVTSNGAEDIFALKLDANGNFLWVFTAGSEFYEEPVSIHADENSNVYVSGYYANPISFSAGLETVTISPEGGQDAFVFKLDGFGNFQWARSVGGQEQDLCLGMDVSTSGNVYLTGYFSSIVDFDPGIGVNELTASDENDAYVLKLSPSGEYVYATAIGGINNEVAWDLAIDQSENVFVGGGYRGTLEAGDISLPAGPNEDNEAFIVKLDGDGNPEWGKGFGGVGYQVGYDINTDLSGNVVFAGYFDGTVDFDPSEETYELVKESSEPYDAFVAKLNGDGGFVFAAQFGGSNFIEHHGVDTDAAGNIYLASPFQNSVDINPNPSEVEAATTQGFRDNYIVKISPNSVLSIGDLKALPEFSLYPNPTSDFIQLGELEAYMLPYRIVDLQGKVVMSGFHQRGARVEISGLEEGQYVILLKGYAPKSFIKI